MNEKNSTASPPLVVFDFDHTLYEGDSGSDFFLWLLQRQILRLVIAIILTPLLAPLVAFLPTRRYGVGGYIWIASVGLLKSADLEEWINRYVQTHKTTICQRLLPQALAVFQAHRDQGDEVIVATGAPPQLAKAILALVGQEAVPILGSALVAEGEALRLRQHCHHQQKMHMLRAQGYGDIAMAYSDSRADLPLLQAAKKPVVVNPKPAHEAFFRSVLPSGTPILNWGCKQRGGRVVN